MGQDQKSYDLFFEFIKTYILTGFNGIDRNDHLIQKLELLTEINNQFFVLGDLIQLKFLFCSKRCINVLGIDPEILSPYHINSGTHPDDSVRMSLGIANRINAANDYFKNEKGSSLLSTCFRIINPAGAYSNLLFQTFVFFSAVPNKTVYLLQVHTNVDWFQKHKEGFHFYLGDDLSKFRFPDKELLSIGIPYSKREFEILKLASFGFSSEQIASKLFLSTNTVNTHRGNILEKSGHSRLQELIAELKERGLL